MNEFQLSMISSDDLLLLKRQIVFELAKRRDLQRRASRSKFISSLKPVEHELDEDYKNQNKGLLSIPNHHGRMMCANVKYIPVLMSQDWSFLYFGGDQEKKYYVYAHVDPTKRIFVAQKEYGGNFGGQPFYIGKGSGDRAYDLKRNQGHGKVLKTLTDNDYKPEQIVKIIKEGLSEAEAFEMEAKWIYYFGTIYNKSNKKKGVLLNLEEPKIPKFEGVMVDAGKSRIATKGGKEDALLPV